MERTSYAVPSDTGFVSMNQYIGVLNAGIRSQSDPRTPAFDYDDHLLRLFSK
jgi:hypothetical protein